MGKCTFVVITTYKVTTITTFQAIIFSTILQANHNTLPATARLTALNMVMNIGMIKQEIFYYDCEDYYTRAFFNEG